MKRTFFLAGTEFEGIPSSSKPQLEWAKQLTSCAEYADSKLAERAWFQGSAHSTRNPCGCLAGCEMAGEFHYRCTECGAEWFEWGQDE
jgi:hypothetical protein